MNWVTLLSECFKTKKLAKFKGIVPMGNYLVEYSKTVAVARWFMVSIPYHGGCGGLQTICSDA